MSIFSGLRDLFGGEEEAPPALAPAPAPDAAPVAEPVAQQNLWPVLQEVAWPTDELVARILRGAGCKTNVEEWASALAAAARRHRINSKLRLAMFLPNVIHETAKLTKLVESMNHRVERLIPVFGAHRISPLQARQLGRIVGSNGKTIRPADQKAIALQVYGGEWGLKHLGNRPGTDDAWVFRGHGAMQLTGRANFERFGRVIGKTAEELPAILSTIEGAAESAAHFFEARCLEAADADDCKECRRIINGGQHGLKEVRSYLASALSDMAPQV